MKILVDIGHPAHVHFYKKPIDIWQQHGHTIFVTSRRKEMATDLLNALGIQHRTISTMNKGGLAGMARELILRNCRLYQIARSQKPDVMTGIGGIFVSHIGMLTRTPSIVFYDTENAHFSNLITYPFCSLVVAPRCYQGWLPPWQLRYPGYHELSYLHPRYFQPDKDEAIRLGLNPSRKNFLVRTVSWQASHDLNEKKMSVDLIEKIVQKLAAHGKVFISSESPLPKSLKSYAYKGPSERVHHLMGYVDMYIGESATMASECAVMGVPSIYLAATGRGYTDEQEEKYHLLHNLRTFDWNRINSLINDILTVKRGVWKKRREKLLADTIDVASFVADLVIHYPESVEYFNRQFGTERKNH